MLRKDIIDGFQQVLDAIEESQILNLAETRVRRQSRTDQKSAPDIICTIRRWACASEKFNDASRILMKMLNIEFLDNPQDDFWRIFLASEDDATLSTNYYYALSFYVKQVPKMIQLLEQDVDHYSPKEVETQARDRSVLSALVIEDRGFSSPTRISILMISVQSLYEVFARLDNVSSTDLCVISCDSGSDKSFDFLGAAKIIEQVRKTILDFWDRVVFYRERKLETHFDLLSKSLPIYDHIGSLEKNEKLSREEAEKMRRSISAGLAKFRDSGAVIPEMQERSTFSPRELMAPEPKLLVSDTQTQVSDDEEKDKTEGKGKENEQTKSSIPQGPGLKEQVDQMVKEALEREQATKESKDESNDEDSEKKEDEAQLTEPDNKDE